MFPAVANDFTDNASASILLNGSDAYVRLGGNGTNGDVALFPSTENTTDDKDKATVYLDGSEAFLRLGGNGFNGDVALFSSSENTTDKDQATIYLDGASGNIRLGGNGLDGDLKLFPSSTVDVTDDANATSLMTADNATLQLGGGGIEGDIVMLDSNGAVRIRLDANSGDIQLMSADVAEQFDVRSDPLTPGTVVAFVDEETVVPTTDPYDRRVAVVIAGAGTYRPAMVLGCSPREKRQSVSVMGKAYCLVDSAYGVIRTGDLLVASPTQGTPCVRAIRRSPSAPRSARRCAISQVAVARSRCSSRSVEVSLCCPRKRSGSCCAFATASALARPVACV